MRHLKTGIAILVGCAVLAGCADEEKQAADNLREQMDKARRRYGHALTLLAGGKAIEGRTEPPAALPAENDAVEAELDEARKLLSGALASNAAAPAAVKGQANLLLGQIRLAEGRLFAGRAHDVGGLLDQVRHNARAKLDLLRGQLALSAFQKALAAVPKDKVTRIRDQLVAEGESLATRIGAATAKRKTLSVQIDELAATNSELGVRLNRKRSERALAAGQKRLDLLQEEQQIDRKIGKNQDGIAEKQDKIKALEVDLRLLGDRKKTVELNVKEAKEALANMAGYSDKLVQDAAASRKQAEELGKEFESLAADGARRSAALAEREDRAEKAFAAAAKSFGRAVGIARQRRQEARTLMTGQIEPSEVLEDVRDDQAFASLLALKGTAALAKAEVGRRRLATRRALASLARDAVRTYGRLGAAAPTGVTGMPKQYLPDPKKTREQAETAYKAAEGDLKKTLLLKSGAAKDTAWICQGQLADAYYAHYQFLRDGKKLPQARTVLAEARKYVEQALADKEQSPYLASVVELKRLMDAARR